MTRKTLGYGGIAVVLLIFIGALTGVIYQQSKDSTVQVNEESEEIIPSIEGVEEVSNEEEKNENIDVSEIEEVKQVISSSHKTLNVAVGWQGHQNFSWTNRQEELKSLLAKTNSILENVSESSLEQDIMNVVACIEKAINDHDVEGVILAHRIMHDLDYYLNGNAADGILYFITHYGNDQNVEELYSYIY
ncbi:hypothetical protein [Alkalihalobacterium alkalinitrilicum]|uniref:hypothetical protein n=1 Tax=Alkalihalobacterium alkalinitrilicum TaxID=427920 RepID=UPI0009950017|nr:hypothetical protein [Alkalihalobacterium alkalinitrilicum]